MSKTGKIFKKKKKMIILFIITRMKLIIVRNKI